jgi:hypothetical protein
MFMNQLRIFSLREHVPYVTTLEMSMSIRSCVEIYDKCCNIKKLSYPNPVVLCAAVMR